MLKQKTVCDFFKDKFTHNIMIPIMHYYLLLDNVC